MPRPAVAQSASQATVQPVYVVQVKDANPGCNLAEHELIEIPPFLDQGRLVDIRALLKQASLVHQRDCVGCETLSDSRLPSGKIYSPAKLGDGDSGFKIPSALDRKVGLPLFLHEDVDAEDGTLVHVLFVCGSGLALEEEDRTSPSTFPRKRRLPSSSPATSQRRKHHRIGLEPIKIEATRFYHVPDSVPAHGNIYMDHSSDTLFPDMSDAPVDLENAILRSSSRVGRLHHPTAPHGVDYVLSAIATIASPSRDAKEFPQPASGTKPTRLFLLVVGQSGSWNPRAMGRQVAEQLLHFWRVHGHHLGGAVPPQSMDPVALLRFVLSAVAAKNEVLLFATTFHIAILRQYTLFDSEAESGMDVARRTFEGIVSVLDAPEFRECVRTLSTSPCEALDLLVGFGASVDLAFEPSFLRHIGCTAQEALSLTNYVSSKTANSTNPADRLQNHWKTWHCVPLGREASTPCLTLPLAEVVTTLGVLHSDSARLDARLLQAAHQIQLPDWQWELVNEIARGSGLDDRTRLNSILQRIETRPLIRDMASALNVYNLAASDCRVISEFLRCKESRPAVREYLVFALMSAFGITDVLLEYTLSNQTAHLLLREPMVNVAASTIRLQYTPHQRSIHDVQNDPDVDTVTWYGDYLNAKLRNIPMNTLILRKGTHHFDECANMDRVVEWLCEATPCGGGSAAVIREAASEEASGHWRRFDGLGFADLRSYYRAFPAASRTTLYEGKFFHPIDVYLGTRGTSSLNRCGDPVKADRCQKFREALYAKRVALRQYAEDLVGSVVRSDGSVDIKKLEQEILDSKGKPWNGSSNNEKPFPTLDSLQPQDLYSFKPEKEGASTGWRTPIRHLIFNAIRQLCFQYTNALTVGESQWGFSMQEVGAAGHVLERIGILIIGGFITVFDAGTIQTTRRYTRANSESES